MQNKCVSIFLAIFFNLASISFAADSKDFDEIVRLFANYKILQTKTTKEIIKQFILNTKYTDERYKYLKIMAFEIGEKELLKLGSFYYLPKEIRNSVGYFWVELNKIEEKKFKEWFLKLKVGNFLKNSFSDHPWNIKKEPMFGISFPSDLQSINERGFFIRKGYSGGSAHNKTLLFAPVENPNLTLTDVEYRDINLVTCYMKHNDMKKMTHKYSNSSGFSNINEGLKMYENEYCANNFNGSISVFQDDNDKTIYAIFIGRLRDSYDGKRLIKNTEDWRRVSSIVKKPY